MTDDTQTPVETPLPTFDFKKEADQINSMLAAWTDEDSKVLKRRELRENRRSVQEERQKGTILEDETIIPDRTIDSNIRRGKVPYNNYVTQSKRTLIITNLNKPQLSVESLELWYTRGMRYPDWKTPWFELEDSMHVHGGVAHEIVYDPSKPFNVSIEYVPRESLIFPLKTKNIQNCPRLLRCYEITTIQLEEFTKAYGFNDYVAKELYERFHKQEDFIKIYKVLLKKDGTVFNAWYTKDCDKDWLRAPQPHDIGLFDFDPEQIAQPVPVTDDLGMPVIDPATNSPAMIPLFLSPQWDAVREQYAKPLPLTFYPVIWFPYRVTENQYLLQGQGRVSLDLHVQEAMTSLLSDTVNGTHRASRFYPCAEDLPGGDEKLAELGPMKHGVVMSRKFTTFQPTYPNPIILAVLQALKIGKADESGQTDFAATARKDANKTAKEMELATEQSQLVITSDMDIFSSPYLLVHTICFKIACHQAIFNLCERPPEPALLVGNYNLQSAGDIEVVNRLEDKNNAKEFFNIVQGTPAAEKILKFLIQRFFPDQADEWIQALEQPDLRQIVALLVNILTQLPLESLNLTPEQQTDLRNVIAAAQSVVGDGGDAAVPPSPGESQNTAVVPMPKAQ